MSNEQFWSIATGNVYLADREGTAKDKTNVRQLNSTQAAQVSEAFGLWDDVSGFKATLAFDDPDLARDATTLESDGSFTTELAANWTRVVLGSPVTPGAWLGMNSYDGAGTHYHEIYIDADSADTFQPGGDGAFTTLVHEIGHSVLDFLPDSGHMTGPPTSTTMKPESSPESWEPSTPMSWDIDQSIAHYGAATTRTGDDTYGFNASFSGQYRSALDFAVNTQPLITIYDSGGNDTLNASGFRYDSGAPRPVHIDLGPGMSSWLPDYYADGTVQTFAVIYQGETQETTAWIENAVGGGGDDEIFGNTLANRLYGRGGADTLDGRGGSDVMDGGSGNDTYFVDDAGDQVFELLGGGEHDKIKVTLNSYDMREWDKGHEVEDLEFVGTGNFTGHGNDLNNVITGGTGGDSLYGYGGGDTLNGLGGADTMIGGTGDDEYWVTNGGDVVVEEAGAEGGLHDKIYTNFESFSLGSLQGLEDLQFVDVISEGAGPLQPISRQGYGTGSDNVMIGAGGRDTLYGFGGKDTLNGRGGADSMYGGANDDIYVVDDPHDVVSETEMGPDGVFRDAGGTDEVITTRTNYTLKDDPASVIENLSYVGTEAFTGVGNKVANVISGSNNNNMLFGNDGNDTLIGFDGVDYLIGGAGADRMEGGINDDTFVVDNGNETGGDVVIGGDGWDTVAADVPLLTYMSNSVAKELRLVLFPDGTPITAEVDKIPNTSAAIGIENILGGIGNDWIDARRLVNSTVRFEGGTGNDTFISGKSGTAFNVGDVFDGGADFDTIEFTGISSNYDIEPAPPELTGWFAITDLVTGRRNLVHDVELAKFSDGVNYSFATGTWTPLVTVADQLVARNASIAASSLFSASDADGDAITAYRFWDSTADAASGHFLVNGVAQGTNQNIDVSAEQLAQTTFQTGTAADDLWVQVFDGTAWSEWKEFHLTPPNQAPVAVANDRRVATDSLEASSLFSASDADGDAITAFRFWDSTADAASGHFVVNGVAQGTNQNIDVSAEQLAQTTFQTGTAADDLWVQVFDGAAWSAWTPFALTSSHPVTGTEGDDQLVGDAAANHLMGLAGNDVIDGRGGADVLDGGAGSDTADYSASAAAVTIDFATGTGHGGDAEGDTFIAIDNAVGSGFDDTYQGGAFHGQFLAGDGNDTMSGGPVFDWLEGGAGDDTFTGTGGQTVMIGGDGNDTMTGSLTSNNSMYGGFGNDVMTGGDWTDWMSDVEGGDDIMHGGGGYDVMVDHYGVNELYGEGGTDWIISTSNQGSLLDGGDDDDTLIAYFGGNTLLGGAGNDILENYEGGAMSFFTGGAGADTFVYRLATIEANVTVTDFEDGVDHIGLRFQPFELLTITDTAEGAVIECYDTYPMLLAGISASQITQDDFVLL